MVEENAAFVTKAYVKSARNLGQWWAINVKKTSGRDEQPAGSAQDCDEQPEGISRTPWGGVSAGKYRNSRPAMLVRLVLRQSLILTPTRYIRPITS
jgi:hypothetical protein